MISVRAAVVLVWGIAPCATAQVSGQLFQVTPEAARITVGDTVTLRFRVRLDERDLLFDTVPQPLNALPAGVRILSVDKLSRTPDRIFHGRARVAFYRPGRRGVPIFSLPFMRAVKGLERATLASDSAFVDVVALLPAGNPRLKDIRELDTSPGLGLWPFAAASALAALLLAIYGRLRRRRGSNPVTPEPIPAPPEPPPSAYSLALEQLNQIGVARWPAQGQVARHYESLVDVLRGYLEAAEGIPARERTTEEQVWALPPHLSETGLRDGFREILDEADLVKFARLRPNPVTSEIFLQRCRQLLTQWHAAMSNSALSDAFR